MSWVQRSLAVLQLFGCEAQTHLPDCWLLRLCGAWESNTLWVKICGVWERRLLGWEGKAKTTPSACRNRGNYYQLEETKQILCSLGILLSFLKLPVSSLDSATDQTESTESPLPRCVLLLQTYLLDLPQMTFVPSLGEVIIQREMKLLLIGLSYTTDLALSGYR